MEKLKYIADAIFWMGEYDGSGHWIRIRDLNYLEDRERYTPAARGGTALLLIPQAFPYEDWMEEYIGTDKNLMEDKRFKTDVEL